MAGRFSSAPVRQNIRTSFASPAPIAEGDTSGVDPREITRLFLKRKSIELAQQNGINSTNLPGIFAPEICAICLDSLEGEGAPARSVSIKCGHVHCSDCMSKVVGNHCPSCRQEGPAFEVDSRMVRSLVGPVVNLAEMQTPAMGARNSPAVGRLRSVMPMGNYRRTTTGEVVILPPCARVHSVPSTEFNYQLSHNDTHSLLKVVAPCSAYSVDHFYLLDESSSFEDSFPEVAETLASTIPSSNSRVAVGMFNTNARHIIPLKSFPAHHLKAFEDALNGSYKGGGTMISQGLAVLLQILKKSGYDPENPGEDLVELRITIITDGATNGDELRAAEIYSNICELVAHFGGRIKLVSYGPRTSLDQIRTIMGSTFEVDFVQSSLVNVDGFPLTETERKQNLTQTLREASANVAAKDLEVVLPAGCSFMSSEADDKSKLTVPLIFTGQYLSLLINGAPASVKVFHTNPLTNERVEYEVSTERDTTGSVRQNCAVKTIKNQLERYMAFLQRGDSVVFRSVRQELIKLKSEITLEMMGDAYTEISALWDAINGQCSYCIDGETPRQDTQHVFHSAVARTQSCRNHSGGNVMMSTPY